MLVKLEQFDIDRFWPIMRKGLDSINGSLTEPDKILASLLDGSTQCWLVVTDDANIIGFVTTQINIVEPEKKKVLLVRDIFSLNGAPDSIWYDGMDTLNEFAKANDCSEIAGYSSNVTMINRAKSLGFDTSVVLIKKEVN
ncbi:MAG: hypothetical protein ACXABY_26715 [Candidatus Thorarchaeota archaeon]|jgi:hypothetical protein